MPKITLSHSDGSEDRYSLEGAFFTVGRAIDTDINLLDGASSGYHAALKRLENDDFEVIDLGSTNPTRVNGRKLTSPYLLHDGDHILFGDTLAVYESENAARARSAEESAGIHEDDDTEEVDAPPADKRAEKRERLKERRRRRMGGGEDEPAPEKPRRAPAAAPAPATAPAASGGGCLGLIVAAVIVASAFAGSAFLLG